MPPPSISQHSWQVQRREGSKNREAARRAPTRTELQMGGVEDRAPRESARRLMG